MQQATTAVLTCIGHAVQCRFSTLCMVILMQCNACSFSRHLLLIKIHALKQIGKQPRHADAFFT